MAFASGVEQFNEKALGESAPKIAGMSPATSRTEPLGTGKPANGMDSPRVTTTTLQAAPLSTPAGKTSGPRFEGGRAATGDLTSYNDRTV